MNLRGLVLFAVMLSASSMYGDQLLLTNGDRLTGTILKSDGKTVTLKTTFAGTIEVEWPSINELVSDQTLAVTTGAAAPRSGTIKVEGDTVTIAGASGTATVTREEVKALRTPSEQVAYEKSLHPPLYRGWKGGIDLGFALTGGNSETTNLSLAFTADRPTSTDKISLYANTVRARNNAPGASPSLIANNINGGARYDRNLMPKLFGFANGDFQSNELQGLNVRALFGGGLGFHAIKSERTTLDLLAGANYTHESYFTLSRNFAALTVGDEFTHKVGHGTIIDQRLFFFPDMSKLGEYHMTFDVGTVTKLNKWLGWQNAFNDVYVTNPPAGKKKNDIIFTTGLNISFSH